MAKSRDKRSDPLSTLNPALDPARNNVEAIALLEQEALLQRSLGERVSDVITRTVGTAYCVLLHLCLFAAWVVINTGAVPFVPAFDPFPYGILTLIVSGEGVLLAIFVLVSQNRMSRQADRRAHLDLQGSMLAEQELTLMLQTQRRLCKHLVVPFNTGEDAENSLLEKTDVRRLVSELDEALPDT